MKRVDLIPFRGALFTPDTVEMLRRTEEKLAPLKGVLHISGPLSETTTWEKIRTEPGPTGLPPEWSAVATGREVYLRLEFSQEEAPSPARREREIAMLWAVVVPFGFVPYTRYPLPGLQDQVFHYLGEWGILMDNLLGAGRGEAGWPGFCCAAQLDVGRWEGSHPTERAVQAHLHRVGYNVGAIDGVVSHKTLGALRASGLHSLQMTEAARKLLGMAPRLPKKLDRPVRGRLELTDVDFSIHPYGQVKTTRTPKGVDLYITGPGRVVIDVREPA